LKFYNLNFWRKKIEMFYTKKNPTKNHITLIGIGFWLFLVYNNIQQIPHSNEKSPMLEPCWWLISKIQHLSKVYNNVQQINKMMVQ
jgi:hypothetical protein